MVYQFDDSGQLKKIVPEELEAKEVENSYILVLDAV